MEKELTIKMDEELLRMIHSRAEEKGLSAQQYIVGQIKQDLFLERYPQVTSSQMEQLKDALEAVDQALGDVADILWGGTGQTVEGLAIGC